MATSWRRPAGALGARLGCVVLLTSACSLDFDQFSKSVEADFKFIDAAGPTGGQTTEDVPVFHDEIGRAHV